MSARIRITATSVYEYVPDFDSDFCVQHGVRTLKDALELDRTELVEGKITPDDIAGEPITIAYQLDITQ